jgi:hypothetical protein
MRRLVTTVTAVIAHLLLSSVALAQEPSNGAAPADTPNAGGPGSAAQPADSSAASELAADAPPLTDEPSDAPPDTRAAAPPREPDVRVVVATPAHARTARFLHGFRLGYNYWFHLDRAPCSGCPSLAQRYGLRSPHSFVIGYEVAYRMIGNSWLNILLVGNASIAGIEQSRVLPSANLLIGAELDESFQIGVGVNIAPVEDKATHMIAAFGWTPAVGEFSTPVHLYFIPDVDGNHRMGATLGVTW